MPPVLLETISEVKKSKVVTVKTTNDLLSTIVSDYSVINPVNAENLAAFSIIISCRVS